MYPQSNGFAERMVQTVENIPQKCDETKEDPYLAPQSYRATPLDHQLKSPAELLTNRKFKTRLPLRQRALLNSTDHEAVKTKLQPEFWTHPHVRSPLTDLGAPCPYRASRTGKVLYHQIEQYRCHLSKNTVPTETRYNCSK